MAKKDKFPSVMYVRLEVSQDCYTAGTELIGVAELGEKVRVGVYKLSEIVEVEGKAVIVR